MKRAVLVSRDDNQFTPIEEMLRQRKMDIQKAGSAEGLFKLLDSSPAPEEPVALILLSSQLEDMGPKPLVEAITRKSPFSHCVVAGQMADEAFHDFFEGYGVLMQVAESPGTADVQRLSARLDKLTELGIL